MGIGRGKTQQIDVACYIDPGWGVPFYSSIAVIIAFFTAFLGIILSQLKRVLRFFRRKRNILIVMCAVAAGLVTLGVARYLPRTAIEEEKVIVIGFDGLAPDLLDRYMSEGRLPNFSKLKRKGTFSRLGTTMPAQSPVAWSSFATGMNPGKHSMFDFLVRDPKTYLPDVSLFRFRKPQRFIRVGGRKIPLDRPRLLPGQREKPVWELVGERGLPAVVLRCPMTFPAQKFRGKILSGFGTPDVGGTQGIYSYYTNLSVVDYKMKGKIIKVENSDTIDTYLVGPRVETGDGGGDVRVPLRIVVDRKGRKVSISIQGKTEELREKEWSRWFRVTFPLERWRKVTGICRFYLQQVEPNLKLYATPMNIDPERPCFPISYPSGYSRELARRVGFFKTIGQSEDTNALKDGCLDDEAFLADAEDTFQKEEKMLLYELGRFKGGLLIFVFGTTDHIQHMFWHYLDKNHPAHGMAELSVQDNPIARCYQRADTILGQVLAYLDEKTTLIVLSDHGFGSYHTKAHLNSWLEAKGYLVLRTRGPGRELLQDVDWANTKAYSFGLSGIYLNLAGREGKGIVNPGKDAKELKDEIISELEAWVDPMTGNPVVSKVYRREDIYTGPYVEEAPDLIVGLSRGYRISNESALGEVPREVLAENKEKWSGDHIFDGATIPGILLVNREISRDEVSIIDVAPTILKSLGVPIPGNIDGKPFL